MYRIIGTDRRYGKRKCYGKFKTLRDSLSHMDFLKRSYGNIIKFKLEEM